MFLSGLRSAMIARHVRDHDLLDRSHAQQLRVLDQVVGVLVVLVVADVISDVVQKRRVRQQISIVRYTAEALTDRVEELKRQLLHVSGVWLFEMSSLSQLADRPLASLSGICR